MTTYPTFTFVKRLLEMLILLLLSSHSNALSLKAEVDRTNISRSETINLIISADESTHSDIDFSQLTFQFDILNTQRSSRFSIRNGKKAANTFWVVTLAPKEVGKLTIPSFQYKNAFSSSITIDVTKEVSTSNNSSANPDIFFEVTSDKKQAYVQEQILVTARLYYKVSLANYEHDGFNLDKARIEQIHKTDNETTFRGERYKVLEELYSLHPQSSGEITVPIQTWRLEKPSRRFGFGNSSNPYLYVRSQPIKLDVLPIPSNRNTNTEWLPSTKIDMSALWKQSPLQASIGEPLNLQVSINAQGLFDYQLPDLSLSKTDNFTIYQAQPETNTIKNAKGVTGIRKINYSIIPRKTGQFTLPAISLTWWNTKADKEEVFQLAAQTIVVAKSIIDSNIEPQTLSKPLTTESSISDNSTQLLIWQLISALFVITIGFLCYHLYRFKQLQPLASTKTEHSRSNIFLSQKKIQLNNIKTAIDMQNWQLLRREIINWAGLILNHNEIHSLNTIALYFPELALPLQQLDNRLYGQHIDDSYNPQLLVELIKKQQAPTHRQTQQPLKELYSR